MSEEPEVNFDAPVTKRPASPKASKKRPPRKAARTVAAKPDSSDPFPGLTRTACAEACNAKGCAISGREYCAHPVKGGLQAADQNNPEALKRLASARAQLHVKVDPDRFK